MSPMICKKCNRTISLPHKHDKRNNEELYLRVWREPSSGVYFYKIFNDNGEVYIEGTDPSPYGVVDTLANEIYELGWKDANDTQSN